MKNKIKLFILVILCAFFMTGCCGMVKNYEGAKQVGDWGTEYDGSYYIKDFTDNNPLTINVLFYTNFKSYRVKVRDFAQTTTLEDEGYGQCIVGNILTNKITINGLKANKEYDFTIKVFEDSTCGDMKLDKYLDYMYTPRIYTYDLEKFKPIAPTEPITNPPELSNPSDPTDLSVKTITTLIGGEAHYCNKDSSGNRKSCKDAGITNKFVCIAYSQIGYTEKETSDNKNSCTANGGSNNYQKYRNENIYWCDAFIEWVAKKAGINKFVLRDNSKKRDKNNYELHVGDVIRYDGDDGGHWAIYTGDGIIHGNWGNKVKYSKGTSLDGKYIDAYYTMRGIAY